MKSESIKKIKKIVFVIPNLRWHKEESTLWVVHPYNICLIAAMIKDQYEISIIDANIDNLTSDDFITALEKEKPDLVGITVLTDEYAPAGHLTAELVKKADRSTITVMGGVYVISNPSMAIADTNIDYAVIGEGEYAFRDLLGFLNGLNDFPNGVAYHKNDKTIIPDRLAFIEDLDALPLPAYDLIDYNKYSNQIGRFSVDNPREMPYARMFTSRGCSIGCIFCQVEIISGKRFRTRSAEKTIAEMEFLKNRYGIKAIVFDDDNFFIKRKRVVDIFRMMIERSFNLKWSAIAVPVFLLDEDLLGLMRESGCQFIDLAIESGSQRVLKEIIKKPVKLKKARKIIDQAKSLGIDVACNFVIGFPGETWCEIRQTLSFAEAIGVDYVKIFIANPLPGTELEKIAIERGVLVDKESEMTWKYGKIKTDEFTPQDLAILRAYEWDRINFKSAEKRKKIAKMMRITDEELEVIRRETLSSLKFN